jgi:transposase
MRKDMLISTYRRTLVREIEEVSRKNGIRIEHINPMNTSRMCSNCGKIGYRKGNSYYCPHCGFDENADVNAAKNIGLRYILVQALKDRREGRDPQGICFLATSRGPYPIEDYQWVCDLINSNPQ